jgi:hypothetical protein
MRVKLFNNLKAVGILYYGIDNLWGPADQLHLILQYCNVADMLAAYKASQLYARNSTRQLLPLLFKSTLYPRGS